MKRGLVEPDGLRRGNLIALWLVAILGVLALSWKLESPPPVFDELQYIRIGQSLAIDGAFAIYDPARERPEPTAIREPFYPFLIAGFMLVDEGMREAPVDALVNGDPAFAKAFEPLRYLNVVAIVSTALFLFFLLRRITGEWIAPWVGALFILLNFEALEIAPYVVSDYVAMVLAAAAAWTYSVAVHRRSIKLFFLCGLALGLLSLTKTVFLPYTIVAMLALAGLALCSRFYRQKWVLLAAVAFTIGFAPPVGGWMARNAVLFDVAAITLGRGGIALSAREILNDMTPEEYAASFVWWTRDFGDNLARRVLPKETYARFDDSNPGGFYLQGHRRTGDKRREIAAANGISTVEAETRLQVHYLGKILANLPKHLAVTVPVFYRGLYIDQFIVLSFPSLVVLTISALRRRRFDLLVVMSIGWYSLIFHALFSINIVRYALPALPTLALATALVATHVMRRYRLHRQRARRDRGAGDRQLPA